MGDSPVYGAFIFAYGAPNLFRRLLGEGALTAAFVPIFKAREKHQGAGAMWQSANAVLSGLIAVSCAIVLAAMAVIGALLALGAWTPNTRLMLQLMALMFPYMALACLGAVFIGILNARGHFFIPALGAADLNIVMIASVWFLAPLMGKTLDTRIFALAIGVLVAGVAQAFFQVPTLWREGFRFRWTTPWRDPTVREVAFKMIPSTIGVAAFQINFLLIQGLAFGENARIVGQFAYAVRLMELPQGVFGISLATFLLPTLSALALEKTTRNSAPRCARRPGTFIFINLLASILLFTLATPIVRLLFERKAFTPSSTAHVSYALVCLVPGLVSFSLVNIFARAFYAVGDILTPMRISIFCLAINLVFAAVFLFGFQLGAGALGLANTISATCNFALLVFALRKKLRTLDMGQTVAQLPALAAIGLAAALAARYGWRLWDLHLGHATLLLRLGEVFAPMTAATLLYFALAWWMRIPSAREMLRLLSTRSAPKSE